MAGETKSNITTLLLRSFNEHAHGFPETRVDGSSREEVDL